MTILDEKLPLKKHNGMVYGNDFSDIIPRYNLKRVGYELGRGTVLTAHLYHKYNDKKELYLPLFMKSFYLSCTVAFVAKEINPEELFERVTYDPDYYAYSNKAKKMVKTTKMVTQIVPHLRSYQLVSNKFGSRTTFEKVSVRFNDPNSKLDLGFSLRAGARDVSIFIGKKARQEFNMDEKYDYATFFQEFLLRLMYPKSVFYINRQYGTLGKFFKLLMKINELKKKGDFQ